MGVIYIYSLELKSDMGSEQGDGVMYDCILWLYAGRCITYRYRQGDARTSQNPRME
jgi:hypothetical protein